MKISMLFLLISFAHCAKAYGPLTPDFCYKVKVADVKEGIERMGIKKYIRYSQPNARASEWDCIINNISSGKSEWMALVPVIAPATDAGSADDLTSAMGIALQNNPLATLGVIDERIRPVSTEEVCTLPFYSGSDAEINLYIVKTIRGLYQAKGEKCLAALIRTIGQSDAKTFYQEN